MFKRIILYASTSALIISTNTSLCFSLKDMSNSLSTLTQSAQNYLKKDSATYLGLIALPTACATLYYGIAHKKDLDALRNKALSIIRAFSDKISAGQKAIEEITFEEVRAFDAARELLEMSDEELQEKISKEARIGAVTVGIVAAIIYGAIMYKKLCHSAGSSASTTNLSNHELSFDPSAHSHN